MTEENILKPDEFLDTLLIDMDMDIATPEVQQLRDNMEQQLTSDMLNAASMELDPETLDNTLEKCKDIESPTQVFIQIIRDNPEAQIAMLEAMDIFREQTLEMFNKKTA